MSCLLRPFVRTVTVAALLAAAAPALAQDVCSAFDPADPYTFENRNSQLFMQAGLEDPTVTQGQGVEGRPAQRWFIEDGGDGTLRIKNEGSELYLEAVGTAGNSPVVQAPLDEGEDAQRWRISDGSDREEGFCRVQNVASGLYLRPLNGSRDEGVEMSQNTLNPRFTSYLWQIAPPGGIEPPPAPLPEGERLRDLAEENWGMRLGTETGGTYWGRADGETYAAVLGREFAGSSPAQLKWRSIRPRPDVVDFTDADEVLQRQEAQGIRPYGTLVWYKDADPAKRPGYWLTEADPSEAQALLDGYLDATFTRYRGRVARWEVNEATAIDPSDGYRGGFWTEGLGVGAGDVPNYVRYALTRARALDPAATLIYNEGFGYRRNPVRQALVYSLLEQLVTEGTPIDGVGVHFHVADTDERFDSWFNHATRVAEELGLGVHITELDVRIPEPTPANLEAQARVYAEVTERFLHLKNRGDLAVWGFTDKYSWLNPAADGNYYYPDVFDEEYAAKPAYYAVQRVLAGGTAREIDRDALDTVEAEGHEAEHGAITTAAAAGAPGVLAELDAGDYAKYARSDFGSGAASVEVTYAAVDPGDLALEVLVDTDDGDPLTWERVGTVALQATGGDRQFATASADLTQTVSGVQTLYLRASGTTGRLDALDAFRFSAGGVASEGGPEAGALVVRGVWPNPASGAVATLRLELGSAAAVGVEVFDALGRRVLAVAPRALGAASVSLPLDLAGLPAGVYVARVTADAGGTVRAGAVRFTVAR